MPPSRATACSEAVLTCGLRLFALLPSKQWYVEQNAVPPSPLRSHGHLLHRAPVAIGFVVPKAETILAGLGRAGHQQRALVHIRLRGIFRPQIFDLSPLAGLVNLQKRDVGGTSMSKEAMEAFRAERERRGLPNVKIAGF